MTRGQNEDESALIYGLESNTRILIPGPSGSSDSLVRFIVGTTSLKSDNYVHLLEYVPENHSLSKSVIKHPGGEIYGMCCSNKHPQLIATCHQSVTQSGEYQVVNECTLWKNPVDLSSSLIDEDSRLHDSILVLESVASLTPKDGQVGHVVICKPEDETHVMNHTQDTLHLWDLETNCNSSSFKFDPETIPGVNISQIKLNHVTNINWSPHYGGNLISGIIGSYVCGIDTRVSSNSKSCVSWTLDAHRGLTRDMDFNPNAQYYVATCGDDFMSKFWDIRNTSKPMVTLLNHSHWIWSIKYNNYHDQLILTCSSDSRVVLSRVATLASQPFGHLLEDEEDDEEEDEDKDQIVMKKKEDPVDEIIATFEEHEDSVYSAAWASCDPWIFASLSFDGRIVINKVPKSEKINILF